ncbi:MAG TPA: alpha/beta fold hydrolase [Woeseiaceae bacterium]|nr:alpha/beta fold hydrolase [Woeseiaceae bacterium]
MRQRVRFATSADGVQIAYTTTGKGPPLLRVANWFTHLEFDRKSAIWRHWFDALSENRSLVRYDPRGTGLSDRNVDNFSLSRWIDDLDAVVDDAGLAKFTLFGLCQGGAVAAAYAALHPNRVSRLVLYDAYAFGAYTDGVSERLAREACALAQMIEVGWGKENAVFREVFARLLMPHADQDELRWIGELQRLSASARNAHLLWDAFQNFDIRDVAANISVPTLVFHGRGDAMVPFEAGRHLASLIPNARFVPLETDNHILSRDEKAWQTFRREFNEFLAPESGPTGTGNAAFDSLTARERDVLQGVARGLNNRELADLLNISEKTVRNHLTAVFSKLGVSSRAKAMVLARDAGFGRD